MRLTLQARVAASALTVGFTSDSLFSTLAVVLTKVVAFVHAGEIAVGVVGRESCFAFASVRVVAGLEEAHSIDRANGGVGRVGARVCTFRFEGGTGRLCCRVGRARKARSLLSVRLVSANWADDASVLLGQGGTRLAFRFRAFVSAGRSGAACGETRRARLAGHFTSLGPVSSLGARLASGVVG